MKVISKNKINYYNTLEPVIHSKRNVKTVRYRLQTMSYKGPKIWDLLNEKTQQVNTLNEFYACLNQNLEVRKVSLPTLQNLPSTDRGNEPFNTD